MNKLLLMAFAGVFVLGGPIANAQNQPTSDEPVHAQRAPLQAEEAWPEGTFGVDYNAVDGDGFRHGPWIRVYGNGDLYYAGEFDHGTPVGEWWYFGENGVAISFVQHRSNPLESLVTMYHPSGVISAFGEYRHPQLKIREGTMDERPEPPVRHGQWALYSEKGKLTCVVHYDNGVKHGLEEHYLPGGAVCQKGQYDGGLMTGEWTSWYDNGMLREKAHYKADYADGSFENYYSNGLTKSSGAFVQGMEKGHWKFYHQNGKLRHIEVFGEGDEHEMIYVNGTFTEWYGEDRPSKEFTYKQKVLDGPFREWYDTGEYVIENFPDSETGEQLQRRVMKGVQLSKEGEYSEGKLDGPVYFYSENGRLTRVDYYNMGEFERTEER